MTKENKLMLYKLTGNRLRQGGKATEEYKRWWRRILSNVM